MPRTNYEQKYHENRHIYLLKSPDYYKLRARLSKERYFSFINDEKVLEYGIGLGHNVFLLKNKEGFDVSKFAVKFCDEKGMKAYTDAKNIPKNDYDVVLLAHVLEHLSNPYEILKMLKEKMKKDGKIIIILPKEKHGKVDFEMDVNQHLFAWNFRTINNLLQYAGFKVIKNKEFYGTGFYKLKFLSKLNFWLYKACTAILGRFLNRSEIMVVAKVYTN